MECNGNFYHRINKKKETIPEYRIFGSKKIRRMNNNQLIEHFGLFGIPGAAGGNKTDVKSQTEINKKAELNTDIDRSMVVKSAAKIVNNVVNEVAQKNTSSVTQALAAGNILGLYGVKCQNVNISDVRQDSGLSMTTATTQIQKQTNTINNSISNTIKKTITNSLPNDAAQLASANNKLLKNFMNSTPGIDPGKAAKIAGSINNEGFGNTTNVEVKQKLDQELKKTFKLNDSFKVDDKDNLNNNVSNKINQENIASCGSSGSSINKLILADIQCANLNISNIKQVAMAKAVLNCVFDQTLTNNIANTVRNNIDKHFDRMYAGAGGDPKKLDQIDDLGYAVAENLRNAAGLSPKSGDTTPVDDNSSGKTNEKIESPNLPATVIKAPDLPSDRRSEDKSDASNSNTASDTAASDTATSDTSTDTKSDSNETEDQKNPDDLISKILSFFGADNSDSNRTLVIIALFVILIAIIILFTSGKKEGDRKSVV